jgi:hypothetical protein
VLLISQLCDLQSSNQWLLPVIFLSRSVQSVVRHESTPPNLDHQALIKQDGYSSFDLLELSLGIFTH